MHAAHRTPTSPSPLPATTLVLLRGESLRFYGSGHKPSANRSGLHVYTGAAEEQQLALRSLRPNLLEPLRARGWRTELAIHVVTAPERVSELQSMILSHRAGLGEDIRIRISNESSSSQVHDPPPRPRACPLAPTHAVKFRLLVPLAQVDAALLAWDWALREWIGRSELAAVVMLRIDLVLKQPILRLPDPWMARKPDAPVVTLFGAKYGAVCEKPALDASSKPWHARVVDLFFFVPVYHIAAFRHAMELQCNATAMLARFGTPPGQTCCYGPMSLHYTGLALAPVRVTPYLRDCFDANSLIEQNPFYRIAQRDESRQNTRVASTLGKLPLVDYVIKECEHEQAGRLDAVYCTQPLRRWATQPIQASCGSFVWSSHR